MTTYLLRRLLLIAPTLLGISLACFILIQFVPGGPVEELISKVRAVGSAPRAWFGRRVGRCRAVSGTSLGLQGAEPSVGH